MPSSSINWSRIITNSTQIPEKYKSFLSFPLNNQVSFPYMIILPKNIWSGIDINEKLIYLYNQNLYYLEVTKEDTLSLYFPIKDIIFIEYGQILLHSWVNFFYKDNYKISSITLDFNTVIKGYFLKVMEDIRKFYLFPIPQDLGIETHSKINFNSLEHGFKYYAKSSLLSNQKPIYMLFQPALFRKVFLTIRKRLISNHLIFLTKEELIIIREDLNKKDIGKFGAIKFFIPLKNIESISTEKINKGNLVQLNIRLLFDRHIFLSYENSKEKKLASLVLHTQKYMNYLSHI